MPDMDGFKLLEHIGLELDLPVIMMSSNGETNTVLRGVTHGAVDFLIKPVRIEELRNVWQHVIRRRSINVSSRASEDIPDNQSEQRHGTKRKDGPGLLKVEHEERGGSSSKKARVVWTSEMHQQFVNAVNSLGVDKAVPKRILELMNVEGLTRENVASHLQKYRIYLKRVQSGQIAPGTSSKAGGISGMDMGMGIDLGMVGVSSSKLSAGMMYGGNATTGGTGTGTGDPSMTPVMQGMLDETSSGGHHHHHYLIDNENGGGSGGMIDHNQHQQQQQQPASYMPGMLPTYPDWQQQQQQHAVAAHMHMAAAMHSFNPHYPGGLAGPPPPHPPPPGMMGFGGPPGTNPFMPPPPSFNHQLHPHQLHYQSQQHPSPLNNTSITTTTTTTNTNNGGFAGGGYMPSSTNTNTNTATTNYHGGYTTNGTNHSSSTEMGGNVLGSGGGGGGEHHDLGLAGHPSSAAFLDGDDDDPLGSAVVDDGDGGGVLLSHHSTDLHSTDPTSGMAVGRGGESDAGLLHKTGEMRVDAFLDLFLDQPGHHGHRNGSE